MVIYRRKNFPYCPYASPKITYYVTPNFLQLVLQIFSSQLKPPKIICALLLNKANFNNELACISMGNKKKVAWLYVLPPCLNF